MGMLSRLTGMNSTRRPTDDVLLVHAMLLMAGADGYIDDEEVATVEGFARTLPEFRERAFTDVIEEAKRMVRKYANVRDSIRALSEFSSQALKTKAFVLAADIALASGDVDEDEDELLESMQRILNVDDQTAQTIIWVLSLKHAE